MAAEISTAANFVDGSPVNAALLNSVITTANILTALISNQSLLTPSATDQLLFLHDPTGTPTLRKCAINTIPGVSDFSAGDCPTLFNTNVTNHNTTPALAFTFTPQGLNKFLVGTGGSTPPAYRLLNLSDVSFGDVTIAAAAIDCSLGNVFTKTLVANTTFSFSNQYSGQVVKVILKQGGTGLYTVGWPTGAPMHWKGGITPVMTTGANKVDIYTFIFQPGGTIYAQADQNF